MNRDIKEICMEFIQVTEENEDDEVVEQKIDFLESLCNELDDEDTENDLEFYADVIEIIEENLFRVLPPSTVEREYINIGPGFDTYINQEDPQMKILHSVYSLLYSLVESLRNSQFAVALIDETFVRHLFGLIKSEDETERSFVGKIIKSIYTYLETRAKQICTLVYESLLEIINNKTIIYPHVIDLLDVLLFIITNETDVTDVFNLRSLFRVLISMHRLPYLFHFYQNLFSCCLLLLQARPTIIVSYTKSILSSFTMEPVQMSNARLSTKRVLCLMELKYILDLLVELIDGAEADSEKRQYEDIFLKLIKPIVDFCLPNLKSYNIVLVNWSIKILSCAEYRRYFHKHPEITQRVAPFMNESPHYVEWDGATFTQQVLYRAYLNQPDS